MKYVGYMLMIPLSFLMWVFWGGYCTSILWNWYAAPFSGATITYVQAAGLQLVVGSLMGLRGLGMGTARDPDWNAAATIFMGFFAPGLMLLYGWILHIWFF